MIVLLVLTDGRPCLHDTMAHLDQLHGPITRTVIHDDTGDADYRRTLRKTYSDATVIGADRRLGFAGAYHNAWRYLATQTDEPFIFNLEDDFLLTRPVELTELAAVLIRHQHLVQLALRRQPWNEEEREAGGIVEQHPDDYTEVREGARVWLEHRRFFTTNPSLYRRSLVTDRTWPNCRHSEGLFTHELLADEVLRFGFWGARDSGEWCHHIGNDRVGVGY